MATAAPTRPAFAAVKYTPAQLEAAWVRAGGKPSMAPIMAAIAGAESKYGAEPYGDYGIGGAGYTSFGAWQVHTPAHPQYNPQQLVSSLDYNAKAAVEISGNTPAGLTNWSTYNSGAYKSYLPKKKGETLFSSIFGFELIPGEREASILGQKGENPIAAAEHAGQEALNLPGEVAGKALSATGKVVFSVVVKGLLLLAGVVLVIYGIMVAVRPRERALSIPTPALLPV